jgi:GNAT superfamily N-acetyltransferase
MNAKIHANPSELRYVGDEFIHIIGTCRRPIEPPDYYTFELSAVLVNVTDENGEAIEPVIATLKASMVNDGISDLFEFETIEDIFHSFDEVSHQHYAAIAPLRDYFKDFKSLLEMSFNDLPTGVMIIETIEVHPDFRGKGLAEQMLKYLADMTCGHHVAVVLQASPFLSEIPFSSDDPSFALAQESAQERLIEHWRSMPQLGFKKMRKRKNYNCLPTLVAAWGAMDFDPMELMEINVPEHYLNKPASQNKKQANLFTQQENEKALSPD